jgi:hypothetical protein
MSLDLVYSIDNSVNNVRKVFTTSVAVKTSRSAYPIFQCD